MKNFLRPIFVASFAVFLAMVASVPSDAASRAAGRSSYDGSWSVAIYTTRGDCGSVRAALRIYGGRVYAEDSSYQAYGAVNASGAIRVTVASSGRSASGTGRLTRTYGSGRWRTATGECLGTWAAQRRAAEY
jgi:hypothetical protein